MATVPPQHTDDDNKVRAYTLFWVVCSRSSYQRLFVCHVITGHRNHFYAQQQERFPKLRDVAPYKSAISTSAKGERTYMNWLVFSTRSMASAMYVTQLIQRTTSAINKKNTGHYDQRCAVPEIFVSAVRHTFERRVK